MKLFMTPAAQALQAHNTETLLDFYRDSHDRLVCRVAELERELLDIKTLQERAKDMETKQADGLNGLLGDMNIKLPGDDAA